MALNTAAHRNSAPGPHTDFATATLWHVGHEGYLGHVAHNFDKLGAYAIKAAFT